MAVLEDEEYQQQVIQAEADLGVAKANLEEATLRPGAGPEGIERAKTLHQKGILSEAELEAAQSAFSTRDARYKVTVAQLANQQAALETARVRLSYTRIRAAWETGGDVRFVGERFVNAGAMLSSNTAILSVIELQPITAVIHVTEKDYFRLQARAARRPDERRLSRRGVSRAAWPGSRPSSRRPPARPGSRSTSITPTARSSRACSSTPGSSSPTGRTRRSSPTSAVVTRGAAAGRVPGRPRDQEGRVPAVATVGIIEGDRAEIVEPAGLTGYVVTLGHHLLENGTALILPANAPGADAPAAKSAPGDKR